MSFIQRLLILWSDYMLRVKLMSNDREWSSPFHARLGWTLGRADITSGQ